MATTLNPASKAPRQTRKPPAVTRERRHANRIRTATPARVGDTPVQVFDVSLDGVGFRSTTPFDAGSLHQAVIGSGPLYLEGRVKIVCVRRRRDGLFEVGAVFT